MTRAGANYSRLMLTRFINLIIGEFIMAMTNKEMLESALKRVNALAGTNGKLYHDNTGWFIRNLPIRNQDYLMNRP